MVRLRGRMMAAGGAMKSALAIIMIPVGLAVAFGLDMSLEARLVAWMPDWLTALTTRY